MPTRSDALKRAIDVVGASVALVVLSPLLALVAVGVRVRMGSPVLFRQQRPGRGGRPFVMTKFRTMTDRRAANGELLPDADRLTRFGRFLVASANDELHCGARVSPFAPAFSSCAHAGNFRGVLAGDAQQLRLG